MRSFPALLILATSVGAYAQDAIVSPATIRRHGREIVMTAAADESLRNSKIVIAVNDDGTKWLARAADLAAAWSAPPRSVKIWVFADHSKDVTTRARESKLQFAIDCVEHRYTILAQIGYGAKGELITNVTQPDLSRFYQPIAPETMAEALESEVCPLP